MNIQVRKMNFIEEYLRLSNQSSLERLEALLKKERKKELALKLKPMSVDELKKRIKQSEEDIKEGRVYTQEEVKAHFKNKFKAR